MKIFLIKILESKTDLKKNNNNNFYSKNVGFKKKYTVVVGVKLLLIYALYSNSIIISVRVIRNALMNIYFLIQHLIFADIL